MNPVELVGPMIFGLLVFYFAGQRMMYIFRDYVQAFENDEILWRLPGISIRSMFWGIVTYPSFSFVFEAAWKSGVIDDVPGINFGSEMFGRGAGAYFLILTAILAGMGSAGPEPKKHEQPKTVCTPAESSSP